MFVSGCSKAYRSFTFLCVGEKSKSLDQLYLADDDHVEDEHEKSVGGHGGDGRDGREPIFMKMPPRHPHSNVRRQLFSNAAPSGAR